MDERVAQKLARHARTGTTYPNAGSPIADQERQRFELKLARHQAAMLIVEAEKHLDEATKPDAAPAKTEVKPEDARGSVSKRG